MTPGGAAEMDMTAAPPNVTPLLEAHRALGAKLIEFGGWVMPLQYTGILEEHRAVRERVGLFDLSHMGELWLEGREAAVALARAVVSDPTRLAPGRAQYSMLCASDGGVIDDLIIYRVGEERFLVVANAANAKTVSDELAGRTAGAQAVLDDRALATALCALQGPRSVDVLAPLTELDLAAIRYYGIAEGEVAGIPALVARTGYTGEDGFEIFVDVGQVPALWDALLRSGEPHGLAPVGLGARDTLRLEAGMPLYGQELTRETTPYDAGLGRVVRLDKDGDFVGRAALERVDRDGPSRRLVGLELKERGIARTGYPVFAGERRTGAVTSGTMSPTLGRAIAMAYVTPGDGEIGTMLAVEIRGAPVAATVVPLPFYRRAS